MKLPLEILDTYWDRVLNAGFPLPQDDYFALRLLNEAVEEIADSILCTQNKKLYTVTDYSKEGTYTADATTNTAQIIDTELDSTEDDYYVGWKVTNITRAQESYCRAYTADGNILNLSPPITDQAAGDEYYIENITDEFTLPDDFIEEILVTIGTRELTKVQDKDIEKARAAVNRNQNPDYFGFENNNIRLYGRPTQTELMTLKYYAYPKLILFEKSAKTSGTDTKIIYLPKDYIKSYPSSRLVGAKLYVLDGDAEGDATYIKAVEDDTDGLKCYVYPHFTSAILASISVCTALDLPNEFHKEIYNYMYWQTYMLNEKFLKLAGYYESKWNEFMEKSGERMTRKKMPQRAAIGKRNSFFGKRREFKGEVINNN